MTNIDKRRQQRKKRVRKNLKSKTSRPRLTVFRSNQHIWAQIIDDQKGETLASATSKELSEAESGKEAAQKVGELLAKRALKNDIKKVYFDRGSYKYHGRIKQLAEAAREKGLNF